MLKRFEIINKIIEKYGYVDYLEIGCDLDKTFSKVNAKNMIGVDPKRGGNVRMTSDEFFEKNKKKFDIVFIDGLHHADQVIKDVRNSLEVLKKNGTIVMHDCNPPNKVSQIVPRKTGAWTGDVWKAWMHYRRKRKDLSMFVIDTDFGVGVIRKGLQLKRPNWNIKELNYDNLEKHRENWLNLVTEEWFEKWLHMPVICFYPHIPVVHKARNLCNENGIEFHNDPKMKHDLLWHFDLHTYQPLLIKTKKRGINLNFDNARKEYLQEKHKEVFGYNILVDPSGKGVAVEKSNKQAAHDGKVINLPVIPKENHVYEKVINNRVNGTKNILDIRVPVIGTELPCVIAKYVPIERRFSGKAKRAKIGDTEKWLSMDEIEKLIKLAELLNLDYGEFDCLRHSDGVLYVVDVNPTPGREVFGVLKNKGARLKSILFESFKKQFIDD